MIIQMSDDSVSDKEDYKIIWLGFYNSFLNQIGFKDNYLSPLNPSNPDNNQICSFEESIEKCTEMANMDLEQYIKNKSKIKEISLVAFK